MEKLESRRAYTLTTRPGRLLLSLGDRLKFTELVLGASGPGSGPDRGHSVVFLDKTFWVLFSTQEYEWVPANCWGNLKNWGEVTCDGLAYRQREVEILLASSCNRNRDKLRLYEPFGSKAFLFSWGTLAEITFSDLMLTKRLAASIQAVIPLFCECGLKPDSAFEYISRFSFISKSLLPESLVFWPLVKGNEDSGNEIVQL